RRLRAEPERVHVQRLPGARRRVCRAEAQKRARARRRHRLMVDGHWPEALAVVVAAALFATLPGDLVPGPPAAQYVVAAVEVALGAFLIAGNRRRAALGLIGVVGATNAAALGYLIHQLLY